MTVVTDGNEYKCKDCKWLTGKRVSVGVECMHPEKQARWRKQDCIRNNLNGHPTVARYKQPSGLACKKFEPREEQ